MVKRCQASDISIHALLAESDTELLAACTAIASISIHALLAESDLGLALHKRGCIIFLSTLSLRRATSFLDIDYYKTRISIHALLAESDTGAGVGLYLVTDFYPRSPCGERRHFWRIVKGTQKFLSTLSLRRATHYSFFYYFSFIHFYPRSPCGERLNQS